MPAVSAFRTLPRLSRPLRDGPTSDLIFMAALRPHAAMGADYCATDGGYPNTMLDAGVQLAQGNARVFDDDPASRDVQ